MVSFFSKKSVRSVDNIIWVGDQDKEGRIMARNYYSLTKNKLKCLLSPSPSVSNSSIIAISYYYFKVSPS
jgi:hypothetical protein